MSRKESIVGLPHRLLEMLRYKRPDGSKTESQFINRFIVPIGAKSDSYGNYILRIGELPENGGSPVIWSSHLDTVHAFDGFQHIHVTGDMTVKLNKISPSNCLGADCTVGVWLMIEMILNKVEGLYIFHKGEECGAKGSRFIVKETPELVSNYKYAIAFDRRGFDSVITHQGGRKGASKEFVESILPMLPKGYKADDGGIFTDTANYVDLIPECTNLSVGYDKEHTSRENLSLKHALSLRDFMVVFDHTKLVAKRDPVVVENKYSSYDFGDNWQNYPRNGKYYDRYEYFKDEGELIDFDYSPMEKLVRKYPGEIALFLEELGINPETLKAEILDFYGV